MTIWRREDITRTNVTMLVSGRADCSEYLQRMGAASNWPVITNSDIRIGGLEWAGDLIWESRR